MVAPKQVVSLLARADQGQAQQRCARQVESLAALGCAVLFQRAFLLRRTQVAPVEVFQG